MDRESTRLLVVPALAGIALFLTGAVVTGRAQAPPPQAQAEPQTPTFTADQLTDLVAPIALYPDGLLSQVLVASTYPLEVVEAQQWLGQNSALHGTQLTDAAKQQPWDASVQALIAFPDVLQRLNQNIRWTTDVGNAFLAQEADVMAAVQRLRAQARANGRLTSTPQQTVTTETQGGQSAVVIQPASPDVIYVPVYDPAYIWGPPVWGYYPSLYYPAFGWGWGSGINIGLCFGGGWGGWGGWGWGPNWFGHSVFVHNTFFHHYGFHGVGGPGFGRGPWVHNPGHRLGVPYPNHQLAGRFGPASNASRANIGIHNAMPGARPGSFPNANRSFPDGNRGFPNGNHSFPNGNQSFPGANRAMPGMPGNQQFQHGANPGMTFGNRGTTPGNTGVGQGFHTMTPGISPRGGASRSFPGPSVQPMPSAPRVNPGFSGGHGWGGGFGGANRMGGFGGGGAGGHGFGGGGGHGFGGGGGHGFGGGGGHGGGGGGRR